MGGPPAPKLPDLPSDILAEYEQHMFLKCLDVLHRVQNQLWPSICQVYESAPPLNPHCFEQGNGSGLRDKTPDSETFWKGPHTAILTTQTADKVDWSRPRIYHSHIKPARIEMIQQLSPRLTRLLREVPQEGWKGHPVPC